MNTYQSHDHGASVSDSNRKLHRINMPADLSGMRVLDIGCNEGFFCAEAILRGASEVIGIDNSESAIKFAKERYPDPRISFLHQSWNKLPAGPFDVVLWLSAMHYEQDPARIFDLIRREISPRGTLILECGVHAATDSVLPLPFQRPNDVPLYPSARLLKRLLRNWIVRQVAEGELTPGDCVPRYVFHCSSCLPTILLVTGKSATGKSSLTSRMEYSATKLISLDDFLTNLRLGDVHVRPLELFVKEHCEINNLEAFFERVDEAGYTEQYIDLLTRAIAPSDEFVVIEGFMTLAQQKLFEERMREKAYVWHTSRV